MWLFDGRQYEVLLPVPLLSLSLFFLSFCMGLLSHPFEFVTVLFLFLVLCCHAISLVMIEHMGNVGLLVVKPRLLEFTCHLKRVKSLIRPWRRRGLGGL